MIPLAITAIVCVTLLAAVWLLSISIKADTSRKQRALRKRLDFVEKWQGEFGDPDEFMEAHEGLSADVAKLQKDQALIVKNVNAITLDITPIKNGVMALARREGLGSAFDFSKTLQPADEEETE